MTGNRCSCVECSKIERALDKAATPMLFVKPERVAELVAIHVGAMRLHFNRHGAAPLVWTVAAVSEAGVVLWELSVSGISCAAPLVSRYAPKATADDDDGKPSAWLEATGTLTIVTEGAVANARICP